MSHLKHSVKKMSRPRDPRKLSWNVKVGVGASPKKGEALVPPFTLQERFLGWLGHDSTFTLWKEENIGKPLPSLVPFVWSNGGPVPFDGVFPWWTVQSIISKLELNQLQLVPPSKLHVAGQRISSALFLQSCRKLQNELASIHWPSPHLNSKRWKKLWSQIWDQQNLSVWNKISLSSQFITENILDQGWH